MPFSLGDLLQGLPQKKTPEASTSPEERSFGREPPERYEIEGLVRQRPRVALAQGLPAAPLLFGLLEATRLCSLPQLEKPFPLPPLSALLGGVGKHPSEVAVAGPGTEAAGLPGILLSASWMSSRAW